MIGIWLPPGREGVKTSTGSVLGNEVVEVFKDQSVLLPQSQDNNSLMPQPCDILSTTQPLGIYVPEG